MDVVGMVLVEWAMGARCVFEVLALVHSVDLVRRRGWRVMKQVAVRYRLLS